MAAPFTASLFSRLQLVEHENCIQNQAIVRLQCQNERLSLTISRLHAATIGNDTSQAASTANQLESSRSGAFCLKKGRNAYEVYRRHVCPTLPSQQGQHGSSLHQDSSYSKKQYLNVKVPSSPSNSAVLLNAMELAASFDPVTALCSHGGACRKEFCDLAHSAFFCCAHGVHCLQPAAAGIISMSKARCLHDAHLKILTPVSFAAPVDDRFCVWIHGHCDKLQPRSNHMCRSGFREVRVLCDARRPQICRSWAVVPSIRCFSSRDNRGNGFSAQSLRRAVERQLPSLLLQVAPESFMFNSAASAMEALQLMLYDADSHVSIVHVV